MKILITGGAGFIASHIVDAYIDLGYRVVVVDDLSTGKKSYVNKKAKFYLADIRDGKKIQRIINKEKPEVINHHAAQVSVRVSVEDPLLDAKTNILGLLNILEAGRTNGLKKIIFASSGGVVYGEASKIPTPEDYHPLKPLSPYGVTKLASENYLHFYFQAYRIPYIALRYGNVYGPRQNPHGEAGVVAIFTLKLLRNETSIINGDGKQTRDYVYVGDVVEANKLSLKTNITGSFNIGTGIETDVIELYSKLRKVIGSRKKAEFGPAKNGEQRRSCISFNLAQRKLGWKPRVNLSSGFADTVSYFKRYEKE